MTVSLHILLFNALLGSISTLPIAMMALVQYSDTESDTEESEEKPPRPAKKSRHNSSSVDDRVSSLPPLPTAFRDLYASSTRVSVRDDPSLHGGRKRVIPHVEGNWPTHIYLECEFSCPKFTDRD